jgi:hypothetical protein
MESLPKTQAKVILGENKAIAALTFETEGPKLELGAIFHVPIRQEAGKTYYKALACKVEITDEQRNEIVKMLGGMFLPVSPALKG